MYSWSHLLHSSILRIVNWVISLFHHAAIVDDLEIDLSNWCCYCCWRHSNLSWIVSSHEASTLNMHIISEITACSTTTLVKAHLIWVRWEIQTLFAWWIMYSEYFCSVCILIQTSDSWLSFLRWSCSCCCGCLLCFLLFFYSLELFKFIIFNLPTTGIFSLSLCLKRILFYWWLYFMLCRTSMSRWIKLWLSDCSLRLHVLFSLFS